MLPLSERIHSGAAVPVAQAAQLERILARKFGAEEEHLGRVIDPQQDRDQEPAAPKLSVTPLLPM